MCGSVGISDCNVAGSDARIDRVISRHLTPKNSKNWLTLFSLRTLCSFV